MYYIPIYSIKLIRAGSIKSELEFVNMPSHAATIIKNYLMGVDREHLVLLILNTKNKVIGIHTVSIGTLDSALVHPREVFKPAILANASSIIIGHNHPSGDPRPSKEDHNINYRIDEAGKLLGIPLLDNIIIGTTYFSFREEGLL